MTPALVTFGTGVAVGLGLGVPLGRRVERAAWHADVARIHLRFLGHALGDVARIGVPVLLALAAVAVLVWTLR